MPSFENILYCTFSSSNVTHHFTSTKDKINYFIIFQSTTNAIFLLELQMDALVKARKMLLHCVNELH